jgi:protoporphyrinogen/coproporphyrinogen III oxidase
MNKKHIVILGGGISGLSCAFFLKQKFPYLSLTLLEKEERAGGWIKTHKKEGFLFEEGPRGFLSNGKGKQTLKLIDELSLSSSLIKADEKAHKKYLYINQKLHSLSLLFLLKVGFFQTALKEIRVAPTLNEDETIYDFFSRRFSIKLAQNLIDPMVRGIFGGDMHTLSMRSCFPKIYEWEQNWGSVTRGFWQAREKGSLFSFEGGMQTLTDALSAHLEKEIHYRQHVKKITFEGQKVVIETSKTSFEADHLITTLPSYALHTLFPDPYLEKIPFLSLTKVSLGFHKKVLKKKGFGYLTTSGEKEILGMTWDSNVFPSHNPGDVICVMLQGEVEEKEAINRALFALKDHLHIHAKSDVIHYHVARRAVAQYPLNHHRFLQQKLPFSFLGSSFYGVGVNDCISQSAHFADNFNTNSIFI